MKASRVKKPVFSILALILFLCLIEGFLRIAGLDRLRSEKYYEDIYDPLLRMLPGVSNPYADILEILSDKGLRGPTFSNRKPGGSPTT